MTISDFKKIMDFVRIYGTISLYDIYSILHVEDATNPSTYKLRELITLEDYLTRLPSGEYKLKDGAN
jgi:hypothetical protein